MLCLCILFNILKWWHRVYVNECYGDDGDGSGWMLSSRLLHFGALVHSCYGLTVHLYARYSIRPLCFSHKSIQFNICWWLQQQSFFFFFKCIRSLEIYIWLYWDASTTIYYIYRSHHNFFIIMYCSRLLIQLMRFVCFILYCGVKQD